MWYSDDPVAAEGKGVQGALLCGSIHRLGANSTQFGEGIWYASTCANEIGGEDSAGTPLSHQAVNDHGATLAALPVNEGQRVIELFGIG